MTIFKQAKKILVSQAKAGDVSFTNFKFIDNGLRFEDEDNTVEMNLVETNSHLNEVVVKYIAKEDGSVHTFTYNLYDCVEDAEEWIDCMLNDFYDICMYDDEDFE